MVADQAHPRFSPDTLLAEIRSQLQHDILYYGWLRQVTQTLYPDSSPALLQDLLVDALIQLREADEIAIGAALASDDIVSIAPWPETGSALRTRLAESIKNTHGDFDHDFCFWVQSPEQS